jgi:O-antigen/teichoic acid export membrane protein
MSVLVAEADHPAVGVLEIQSFTLVAVSINTAYAAVLVALRRHRDLVVISLVTLAITAVAAGILVPLAEARGGAYATLIGEWSLVAAAMFVLWRIRPAVHPGQAGALKAVGAGLVAGAVATLIDVPSFPNLGPPVVAGLVYVAALALVRGIPRELIDALIARAPRSAPKTPA